jgi:hypothetical protein
VSSLLPCVRATCLTAYSRPHTFEQKFRQPRNGAGLLDTAFLQMMHGEITAFMDQEYSWRVVDRDDVEEPQNGEEIMVGKCCGACVALA